MRGLNENGLVSSLKADRRSYHEGKSPLANKPRERLIDKRNSDFASGRTTEWHSSAPAVVEFHCVATPPSNIRTVECSAPSCLLLIALIGAHGGLWYEVDGEDDLGDRCSMAWSSLAADLPAWPGVH